MAARFIKRPRAVPIVPTTDVTDPATSRALDDLRTAVQKQQARGGFEIIACDLVVGTNAIVHSLGRDVRFVVVMPTVADATFGWCINRDDNLHPDRQVLIDVVGVAQPGAAILVM